MPGDDMPPEPIVAMLAQLEDETAHMTPEYLEAGLAQVEAEYARREMDRDEMIERLADRAEQGYELHQLRERARFTDLEAAADRHVEALDAEAIRRFGPDVPLTEREQDRLDEWRMDANEEGRDV